MVKLEGDVLRQVQLVELEMLEEVDRICRKCGIKYTIIGGTLIGAVRHKGFIPWDDDADVAFMRPEYEKFRRALKTELDTSRFYFQDYRATKGYRWGYGKLRRKGTTFLREHQEHMPYHQGIFIDLFAMDYTPNNFAMRSVHNFFCFVYRKFFWSEVGKVADKSPFMRMVYSLMSLVPERKLKESYSRFVAFSDRKKTNWVRMLTVPVPNPAHGYLLKWHENMTDMEFEGVKLMGMTYYDAYLTFIFGDYMKFPPVEERGAHPVSKLRLLDGKVRKN